MAGWSSQSSYALLGCLRITSQLLSYELVLATLLLLLYAYTSALSLEAILAHQLHSLALLLLLPSLMPLWLVALLAETNRAPFDLPEAEAELVAGYNVEYGSSLFTLFFLAEYNSILSLAVLISLLLVPSGHSYPLPLATTGLSAMVVLVRAAYPRYRYDQLLALCWRSLLPFLFGLGSVYLLPLLLAPW